MLAMLAGRADVLLLDEPTYAQDERSTRKMLDVLEQRVADGLTVVVATHDLVLARAIANQVLLVGDGRVRPLEGEELDAYVEARREPATTAAPSDAAAIVAPATTAVPADAAAITAPATTAAPAVREGSAS